MSRRRTQGRTKPRKRQRPDARLTRAEQEAALRAQEVTRRAIRRLDILEWVTFGAGALMATLAGAAVAWVMAGAADWPFRTTWIVASMLLFVIPGAAAIIRIRKDRRALDARSNPRTPNDG